MRIAVDATSLLLPSAGVKTYLYYWLSALLHASADRGDAVVSYTPGIPVPEVLDHQASAAGSIETQLRLRIVQMVNAVSLRRNPLLDLFLLGSDLFHCSQHTGSLPRGKKNTATIFDLSCWITPEYHTRRNIAATRRYGEKILTACDGLIAISEHTRQDAAAILGIPLARIQVIYPGVADAFFEVNDQRSSEIKARYRLAKRYMLFVGCIEPRKNVPAVVSAYRRLPESLRTEVHLVLAGTLGWESDEVRTLLGRSGGTVRHLGYVPEPDLPGLVRGAEMLVYPSFYEGFGLPVAQAMAAGTPVITSNRSSLPEIAGGAAICIDPGSVEELSTAMERLLACPEIRCALAARGRCRAEKFRWSAAASQSLDFFHQC